jgi:hypothetical protein
MNLYNNIFYVCVNIWQIWNEYNEYEIPKIILKIM